MSARSIILSTLISAFGGALAVSPLLFLNACTHHRTGERVSLPHRVSIRPDPIPPGEEYPHRMGVRITPPWKSGGEWLLRAPETLGSDQGLLFIDHSRDDMIPVTWPRQPLTWKQESGGLEFECELDMGVVLRVRIVPHRDEVTIEGILINGSAADLSNLGTQFCLVQSEVTEFVDPLAERTLVMVGGKFVPLGSAPPGPAPGQKPMFIVTNTWNLDRWKPWEPGRSWFVEQQADIPLIATVSRDGTRVVAVAFDNAYKIMTNCDLPCIHADPRFPDCPPGGIVRIRGKLYFIQGSLADVFRRFQRDFPGWQYPPDRYIIPEKIATAPRPAPDRAG